MTIKTKLACNIVFVLLIIGVVVATSIISMGFVRAKLHYLTEQSTPHQIRSGEFQRAIQAATAAIVKVSASTGLKEYKEHRAEADSCLQEVKEAQEALKKLSTDDRMDTYAELEKSVYELIRITESRLAAEEEVLAGNRLVGQKLREFGARLTQLDKKIGNQQTQRLAAFSALLEESKDIDTVRDSPTVTQFNIATKTLLSNSQLVTFGLSLEGLAKGIYATRTDGELNALSGEIQRVFDKANGSFKSVGELLKRLNAKEELALLNGVHGALISTRGVLGSSVARQRHFLKMRNDAMQLTDTLANIALKQAEKGKSTVTAAQGEQEKAIAAINRMVRFNTTLLVAIGVGAGLFGIGFGLWIYRSIQNPLARLIAVSDDVAGGNLASVSETGGNDEIGRVEASMAKMVHNLRDMVGRIGGATQTLASSSEELSTTATTIERGSEEQSVRVEQSATAMSQMAQTTNEVAQNSTSTSEAAGRMKKIAEQGKEAMHCTVQELEKFAETVKEAAGKVESLGAQSEEISGVVSLIEDIADQTNLLALNAAIEAARAGEQGRGFAVVADEVRALAERTTTATKEISQTVKSMQGGVHESVNYMKDERASVETVLAQVNSTLKAIDEIVRYVEEVTAMVQRIAVAADEQASSTGEVTNNMHDIANITRDLKTSFADIKHSSKNLSQLATDLNGMVEWFKVA
ncbi:MAG: methyl-accepting chemotaxis [Geobacteraceae bacterium]|nr:MAG: methyl-accepting chemotaxis [Geobacteraceae bacterium]